jgi:hypothetical protein
MEIQRQPHYLFLRLLINPLILSVLICVLWDVLYFYGIHISESDESAFTDTVIPTLAVFHALFGSLVIGKVWNEYQTVKRCIRHQDEEGFKDCMQDRISRAVLLLLFVLSVLIQFSMMILHWDSAFAGFFANFVIALALTLVWEVATNLDNPRKALWYRNIIPEEWMKHVP